MIDETELIQRFILHENCELMPYKCPSGYLTLGIGRNLEANPLTVEERKVCGDWRHGITKNAAFYLLRNDIKRVQRECQNNIPFFDKLDNERQYALLDMAFNLGITGLLKFKLMLEAIGVRNFNKAAEECLNSRYAKQTGKRAKRIAETIKTGKWRV